MPAEDQITAAYLKALHEQLADISGTLRLLNEDFVHKDSFAVLRAELLKAHGQLKRDLGDSLEQRHTDLLSHSLIKLQNSLDAVQYQQLHLHEELIRLETALKKTQEEHRSTHRRASTANKEALSHNFRIQERDLVGLFNALAALKDEVKAHDKRIARNYLELDRKFREAESRHAAK